MIDCDKCIHKAVCGKMKFRSEFWHPSDCRDYSSGRPHGKWLFAEEYGTHYCSNCRRFAYQDQQFDYCPDCGAEMWR